MQEDAFCSLKKLKNPGMYEYQIKVLVTRVWNGEFVNTNGRTGLNMFLTDNKDNRMHCWLPSTLTLVFNEDFVEGESYIIKNFMVSTYKGKYRCCDDQFHIILMDSTIAFKLSNDNTVKANEIFKFTKLSMVDTSCFQDEYCIDVIGVLQEREPLDFLVKENNEEEPFLDFFLKQNRYEVKVRFTGELAKACNNDFIRESENCSQPTVIAISSCKIVLNKITNKTYLSNAASTRFFLNSKIPEIILANKRYYNNNNHNNNGAGTSGS